MAFVPRKYRPTVTDRETCQLSNLHDFWFLSAGNYHPMMWSLLPVCHPPVPSLFPSSLLSILSISHSTLIQEVWLHEAAERREHPRGYTNVQNRMQQLWRWARERLEWEGVGVHYYNHFTSLEKVALKAGSVEETRMGEYVERGEERWAALMAVSKSKAQLHFSTFIAFSHEHPEHPHNNQRHFSGILASP